MIGYLKGKVLHSNNGTVLLDCNGIGYEVTCSSQAFCLLTASGEGAIYTYMNVTENGVSLYGFESLEEKSMFLKLISVSGVGPKMGITVLSNMKLSDLAVKIATSDVKGLSSIKGLGKKTAERIILELREKITEEVGKEETSSAVVIEEQNDGDNEDAIIALMSLGFTKQECVKAVKDAKANGAESIQQLISYALKSMR
jgi:Holliday junction DNA helicase RuvA